MSDDPLISVVMSVFNDAQHVATALDSMLSQEAVDLEFIVIDDGSTDGTGQILDGYAARDPRLRVIHQKNSGLTRALIRGCDQARGKYIARQDGGGDVSLPGRLRAQSEFLESHPDVVMTSCGTRFTGPEGEELYEVVQRSDELQRGLQELSIARKRGPSHHGSTMFLRSAYRAVGGYRPEFAVGQDQDLWSRMAEAGRCAAISWVLYEARLSCGSISATRRREQTLVMKALLESAKRRRAGLDDREVLEHLVRLHETIPVVNRRLSSRHDAEFYYFIGSLLRHSQPYRAEAYLRKALRTRILFPRALLRFGLLKLVSWAK